MRKSLRLIGWIAISGFIFAIADKVLWLMGLSIKVYGPLRLIVAALLFLLLGVRIHKAYTLRELLVPISIVAAYNMICYIFMRDFNASMTKIAIYKIMSTPVSLFSPIANFSFFFLGIQYFVTDAVWTIGLITSLMPCLFLLFAKKRIQTDIK